MSFQLIFGVIDPIWKNNPWCEFLVTKNMSVHVIKRDAWLFVQKSLLTIKLCIKTNKWKNTNTENSVKQTNVKVKLHCPPVALRHKAVVKTKHGRC